MYESMPFPYIYILLFSKMIIYVFSTGWIHNVRHWSFPNNAGGIEEAWSVLAGWPSPLRCDEPILMVLPSSDDFGRDLGWHRRSKKEFAYPNKLQITQVVPVQHLVQNALACGPCAQSSDYVGGLDSGVLGCQGPPIQQCLQGRRHWPLHATPSRRLCAHSRMFVWFVKVE